MKKLIILLAAIIFSGMQSGCLTDLDGTNPRYGLIYGEVNIGPLCPVEPCHITEDQIDEAYAARKIVIYLEDTSTVVRTVSIDDDHYYRVYLLPGKYVVDINHDGIDYSSDVPKAIKIEPDKILRLDIDIDTGIR